MPIVNITNRTDTALNMGFWGAGAPVNARNALQPGETWSSDMASWSYTLDARADHGDANRFTPAEGWRSLATIGSAVGGGVASVTTGAAGAVGLLSGRTDPAAAVGSFGVAGKLMDFAHQQGTAYATDPAGLVMRINWLSVGFAETRWAVRQNDAGAFELYDEGNGTVHASTV